MDASFKAIYENWGAKRICQVCSTRFYDMDHDPIMCPKCGNQFIAENILKSRGAKLEKEADVINSLDAHNDVDDIDIPEEDFIPAEEDDIEDDIVAPDLDDDDEV